MVKPTRAHGAMIGVVAALTILLAGGVGLVLAQTVSVPFEARVVAQKHESGAVEFAIEHGGERYLPVSRFLPDSDL